MGIKGDVAVSLLDPEVVALESDLAASDLGSRAVGGVFGGVAPAADDRAAGHGVDRAVVDEIVGVDGVIGLALFQDLPIAVGNATQDAQVLGAGLWSAAGSVDDSDDAFAGIEIIAMNGEIDSERAPCLRAEERERSDRD